MMEFEWKKCTAVWLLGAMGTGIFLAQHGDYGLIEDLHTHREPPGTLNLKDPRGLAITATGSYALVRPRAVVEDNGYLAIAITATGSYVPVSARL